MMTMHDECVRVRARVGMLIEIGVAGQVPSSCDVEIVTFSGLPDNAEHVALVFPGDGDCAPLVRIHSECLTGDVFGSARCDCGKQLEEALGVLQRQGGILLYLRQEGRGIGLYNKIDAYSLQLTYGLDTFEANAALGFPHDMRNYKVAAAMMCALSIHDISLLTNNPDKVSQLIEYGVRIHSVIPTGVFNNHINHNYLQAKVRHANHSIHLSEVLQ
jgi:GTP cyclohydrolase II